MDVDGKRPTLYHCMSAWLPRGLATKERNKYKFVIQLSSPHETCKYWSYSLRLKVTTATRPGLAKFRQNEWYGET